MPSTAKTEDCFFDIEAIEAEDLRVKSERASAEDDGTDPYPLAGLNLPAPSPEHFDAALFLESIETGTPLPVTRSA